jgi:hypothetical protein
MPNKLPSKPPMSSGRSTAIACALALFLAGCGGSKAASTSPSKQALSVAQLQTTVEAKLDPPTKSCTVTPTDNSEAAKAVAKAKEFGCYPDLNKHLPATTHCVDDGSGKYKCQTDYSGGVRESQLTNATCPAGGPVTACIFESS